MQENCNIQGQDSRYTILLHTWNAVLHEINNDAPRPVSHLLPQ